MTKRRVQDDHYNCRVNNINMYPVIKQRKRGFNKFIELQRERIDRKSLGQKERGDEPHPLSLYLCSYLPVID
jgi:hypothetical protein